MRGGQCEGLVDREGQMLRDFTYMWNLKDKTNKQTNKIETHKYREQTGGSVGEAGEEMGETDEKGKNWNL